MGSAQHTRARHSLAFPCLEILFRSCLNRIQGLPLEAETGAGGMLRCSDIDWIYHSSQRQLGVSDAPVYPWGPGHTVQLPWLLGTQWAQPGVEVTSLPHGREEGSPSALGLSSSLCNDSSPCHFDSGPQDVLWNLSSYTNLTSGLVEGSQCSPSVRPPITQFGFQLHIIISSISN